MCGDHLTHEQVRVQVASPDRHIQGVCSHTFHGPCLCFEMLLFLFLHMYIFNIIISYCRLKTGGDLKCTEIS